MIFCIVTPLLFDNFDIDYKKIKYNSFSANIGQKARYKHPYGIAR